MKRIELGIVAGLAGAFALIGWLLGHHTTPSHDPCQNPYPSKRPADCSTHGGTGGHAYFASTPDRAASNNTSDEAESAGHAGFGESAGGHAGGGGE